MRKTNDKYLEELEESLIPINHYSLIHATIARGGVCLGILPKDMTEEDYIKELQAQIQKYTRDRGIQRRVDEECNPNFKMD